MWRLLSPDGEGGGGATATVEAPQQSAPVSEAPVSDAGPMQSDDQSQAPEHQWDEGVLADAPGFGLSRDEVQLFGDSERARDAMSRIYRTLGSHFRELSAAEAAKKAAQQPPKPALKPWQKERKFQLPEESGPEFVEFTKALNEMYAELSERIGTYDERMDKFGALEKEFGGFRERAAAAEVREMKQMYDNGVKALGDEYASLLGTGSTATDPGHIRNNRLVGEMLDRVQEMFPNEDFQSQLQRAVAAALPNQVTTIARRGIQAKVTQRQTQFTGRPGQRGNSDSGRSDVEAGAGAIKAWRERWGKTA